MRSSSSMDHTITHCHKTQRACRRNDATPITPWGMLNSIRSPPSFVLSIKAIVCRTISVHFYAFLLVHGSYNHTLSQDTTCLSSQRRYAHHSMGHVELDSKSPFVRLINQSHRMSNNLCKLSIRRLRCYYPVHSRAVDKLNHSHGPSSESIAAVPKDQVTMTRDPQSANKQPFYCPRGSHRSNSVRFLTTEHFLRRS